MSSSGPSVESVFADYVQHIQEDQDIREEIRTELRELEQTSRELSANLQKIHQPGGVANIPTVIANSKTLFTNKARPQLAKLIALIPAGQYYRFHPMYNHTIQRICFAAALTHYFDKEVLITREETAADFLDIKVDPKDGFHLDLEDYLAGVILTSNELSRFCVNSVTHGDYNRPLHISTFLNDLLNGFRLLNLKNDNLRKKFDSLKYDLKKVEEVVYDLSIRGLIKQEAASETGDEKKCQPIAIEENEMIEGGKQKVEADAKDEKNEETEIKDGEKKPGVSGLGNKEKAEVLAKKEEGKTDGGAKTGKKKGKTTSNKSGEDKL